jgi:prolyl oligopeptidase
MTRLSFGVPLLLVATIIALSPAAAQRAKPDTTSDPFLWLEDVHGDRAMAWVRAENAKTTAVLEKDPRFGTMFRGALTVAQASDRIPFPRFIGRELFNFWQDSAHVRGVWRRTSVASYRTATPKWTTVLDLDSLARAEHANWVWHGVDCALPAERRCLLQLSDGGEDAVTVREFDLQSGTFVADGFNLPRGKQRVTWVGQDTLLIAREWAPGQLTSSGYPFIVKRLARGQLLSNAAEVFRGSAADGGYGVSPSTYEDAAGDRIVVIDRPLSTFEAEKYLVSPTNVSKLALPLKSSIEQMIGGKVIVLLRQDWTTGGKRLPAGSLVSIDGARVKASPASLVATTIYEPGPRESIEGTSATSDQLLVTIYQNVKGRVVAFTPTSRGTWTRQPIKLPDNMTTGVISANRLGAQSFIAMEGFLRPSSLWLADAADGSVDVLKTLPPKFDASNEVVEQFEATSKDGTKIPYFIVHPGSMKLDGLNPTILYAYGGFSASMTPNYSPALGKLWLERGGVYVLANIRGGGEFGPAWHEAGLKTKRQVIYDDFAAVARDLIARKVTTPRRLGIEGGSNGGLLMGVQFTQHPELWNAVDIQVPLLDMVRFEQIQAGASWVGEYGSVSNPDERAFLRSISPYHNVKRGVVYPTPFIWTTTKDDRVGPQHARKFAALLSSMHIPYLFYEVTEGGHGSGANLEQSARTTALEYTYFAQRLMGRTAPEKPFR